MALESAGVSIISKIAGVLVEPSIKQFRYMFCLNSFVEEFNERKQKLDSELDRLHNAVQVAQRNAEVIEKDVKKWLEDATKAIDHEDVKHLENEIRKNDNCFTCCPNCMRQFKLSKALAKKSETFRELLEKKPTAVSRSVPPEPIEFLPSKEFKPSKSSEEAFKQIMDALKDDKVNMIGLFGMGGVGKTTLVKEVGRIATESQLFDEVLMATVSKNPNVDIQNQMADKLCLDIKEKSTNAGRADRLRLRLKKVEKMLIILDDVWKHIDLKEIGIPFGDDHRGCKILLTTRLQGLCSFMVCQQNVFLDLFSKEEAWDLFRSNAGLDDGDSTSNRVARDVARECHGLPIALVTVGKALRDKSEVEWEVAFRQLKNFQFPDMEYIDEQRTAYACLKLSYDYLESKETKLCFLLCCLFPEDYNIPMEDLTRYAVGYELHQNVESIGDARKRVYVEIKKLKDCSMLLDTETDEHVKMHDLVRDVAIRIASSEEYGFVVKAGIELKEWPMSIKSFEACTAISLMGNKLTELPEGLECPQLKVLLLKVDDRMNVPERFFEGMKEIKVLSLEGGCLSLQSLELSTKLQSLVLIRCNCKDLIPLRKLQRLKILVFKWCLSIEELPDEIGELKELRLLDLTACANLRRIPVNLIGRLKKLEELLIVGFSFLLWDVVGCDSTGGMNAKLTELNSLSQLAVLSLWIPKVECIPRDFVFPVSLLKYHIIVGIPFSVANYGYPTSRRLILAGPSLNAKTYEQLFLHKLESVEVCRCGDIFTRFPARLRQGLKNLKEVVIDSCKSLEEVFELGEADEGSSKEKELPLLSSLTKLRLSQLPEVKCIWKGPTRHVSLQSLAYLSLNSLDKLAFIFTPSLAQSLPKLERLFISKCGELKHIIREEDGGREIIPESPGFPKLKTLLISGCGKLEYVFLVSVSLTLQGLPQLQTLEIKTCGELKHIIKEEDGEREIIPESPRFPELKTIIIEECGKLEYVLPVSVSPSLLNLEEMRIFEAHNLKQIFYSGEGDALTTDGIIKFPRLSKLDLSSRSNYSFFGPKNFAAQLPSLQILKIDGHKELGNLSAQLQMAAHGQQNGSLQRLERVQVKNCGDVRAPFPAKLLRALKNLEVIFEFCGSLEEVFELGEADEGSSEEKELPVLSSLTTLRLSGLPEVKCIWKGPTRHVSLQSLNFLTLNSLDKLTFIFTPSLAQNLPKLAGLFITNCAELQHIIREEDGEREIIPESPCFPELKYINISFCDKLEYVFPVSLSLTLQGLPQLQTLEIKTCGELKHIIREEDGEREIIPESPCFPELKYINISLCDKLEYVFPVSLSLTLQGLPQLQTLEIITCGELKHIIREEDGEREIIQESPGFPKLKTMFINECGKLEYVFPVSVSPSLPNLEKMQIFEAHNLKQIFYSGEGDALTTDGIIKFPRLSQLNLSSRSNYSFFGPKNFAAQLPSLQFLTINGHKELGNLSAQLQGLTNLKELSLRSLPDMSKLTTLEMAVHGQQNGSLQRLEPVQVWQCGDVRAPFPAKLLRALKNLGSVRIYGCKSLEEVFELGEPDEGSSEEKELPLLSSLTELGLSRLPELKCMWKGPTRHVSLQSLAYLDLWSLDKLTFIFTPSLARSLSKLKRLYISKCGQLKYIIREEDGEKEIIPESPGQDDQASPINVEKEMVLPNLWELSLEQLPSIVCFSFEWCDYFLFPNLGMLKVHQCPKLTTKFATTPDGSMSAQSEVSEVAEYSSINRERTRNNGWKEVEEEEEDDDDDEDDDW